LPFLDGVSAFFGLPRGIRPPRSQFGVGTGFSRSGVSDLFMQFILDIYCIRMGNTFAKIGVRQAG
ncbi:MAG TPA: hypothetical protein VNB95_04015, partial [Nitrososphaera sp.]|nr:hypothetical protein [Nitrososphaera sp.]